MKIPVSVFIVFVKLKGSSTFFLPDANKHLEIKKMLQGKNKQMMQLKASPPRIKAK